MSSEETGYGAVLLALAALADDLRALEDPAIADRIELVRRDVQGRLDTIRWNRYAAVVNARGAA
jgi:hypothetical protein